MNRFAFLTSLAIAVLSAQPAFAESCATRTAKIDGEPVRKVIVGAGAGDLSVVGDKARTAAKASGEACASTQALLDQVQIETRREGDVLYIKTVLPESSVGILSGMRSAHLDLTVELPDSVAVEIADSSGDLEVREVRSAVVVDSSGDMRIANIHGDLKVHDSSGDIHIDTVTGNVQVEDSSSDIDVAEVTGDVEIPIDSSGGILLRGIGGNVHIGTDSSGDIVIQKVKRDVTIDNDSSGDIEARDIGGNFTVSADGSGDIRSDRVAGKVTVPRDRD